MSNQLHITLTTPERQVLSLVGESITIPTETGEITVLPGHAPIVALLQSGMATVRVSGSEEYLAVSGGFVRIEAGNKVMILADTAERAEELDMAKVEEARERARKVLVEGQHADDVAAAAAMAGLERELARLKVAQKYRGARRSHTPTIEQ
jgi:F-type H+-transporting ATPase subunit epsilon